MDFDEYEYLERTVENVAAARVSNGAGGRGGTYISKKRDEEEGYRRDDRSKRIRIVDELEKRERSSKERGERDRRDREMLNDKERHRGDTGLRENRAERFRERGEKDRVRDVLDRDSNIGMERRERDRDRVPDRDKERGREKERERSHSRSRDVVDRQKDRERDGLREKEFRDRGKDKEYKEKGQEGERRRSKEQKEKKEEPQPEPEVDLERDQRTVFAYQICLRADERDVYEFFSKAGKVRDVRLIMDRNSRRSKGVGYIEFYDAMSVPMAIALSGQLLQGQPVMVKPSEAEKNLAHSAANAAEGASGFIGPYSGGARRLYVGNLHFNITEDQLRQVFEPFGPVELVQLPTDLETGQCKGFGFVQYIRLEDSRAAQQALNGVLELAGRVIKVSAITDQVGSQDIGVVPGELDDDDGGGLSLTARSRALLMQKLDRSGTISSVTASSVVAPVATPTLGIHAAGVAGVSPLMGAPVVGQIGFPAAVTAMPNTGLYAVSNAIESIGAPTDCLMLRNMFDPSTETDPDFELDIKDEVQQECSKFGPVKHIFVDKNSLGHVYLRFDTLTSALNAQQALHGRWFAGKMISTKFLNLNEYETRFPESR